MSDPGTQQLLGRLEADVRTLKIRVDRMETIQRDHARRFGQIWGVLAALGAVAMVFAVLIDLALTLADQADFKLENWQAAETAVPQKSDGVR